MVRRSTSAPARSKPDRAREESPHDWYVRETIERAEGGFHEAARDVLHLFAVAVETRRVRGQEAADAALLSYVATRMRQYLESGGTADDLARVFGVKRPKKRPPDERLVAQSVARAAAVELLMRHGWEPSHAVEEVSAVTGYNRKSVFNDRKGWIDGALPERYLSHLALSVTRSPDFPPLTILPKRRSLSPTNGKKPKGGASRDGKSTASPARASAHRRR